MIFKMHLGDAVALVPEGEPMTGKRRIRARLAALAALAAVVLTTAPPAFADDNAALRARMAELEAKQAAMLEEMKALRA